MSLEERSNILTTKTEVTLKYMALFWSNHVQFRTFVISSMTWRTATESFLTMQRSREKGSPLLLFAVRNSFHTSISRENPWRSRARSLEVDIRGSRRVVTKEGKINTKRRVKKQLSLWVQPPPPRHATLWHSTFPGLSRTCSSPPSSCPGAGPCSTSSLPTSYPGSYSLWSGISLGSCMVTKLKPPSK